MFSPTNDTVHVDLVGVGGCGCNTIAQFANECPVSEVTLFAEPDQKNSLRRSTRKRGQHQRASRLAVHVSSFKRIGQGVLALFVEHGSRLGQQAVFKHPNNHASVTCRCPSS